METPEIIINNNNNNKFKSHYVVWKLTYECKVGADGLWFKSHYVVWKQVFVRSLIIFKECLNRTM